MSGLSATNSDSIVIIGGGVIGLSIAYELACRGQQVHVVERGTEFGKEASWAGGHSTTGKPRDCTRSTRKASRN